MTVEDFGSPEWARRVRLLALGMYRALRKIKVPREKAREDVTPIFVFIAENALPEQPER